MYRKDRRWPNQCASCKCPLDAGEGRYCDKCEEELLQRAIRFTQPNIVLMPGQAVGMAQAAGT